MSCYLTETFKKTLEQSLEVDFDLVDWLAGHGADDVTYEVAVNESGIMQTAMFKDGLLKIILEGGEVQRRYRVVLVVASNNDGERNLELIVKIKKGLV